MPTTLKLLKFLAAGIPAFLIAIPLNWFLVESLQWPKSVAYALVLLVQVTINFFTCILFVFRRDRSKSLGSQFIIFTLGIATARLLDWAIYTTLITATSIHYLAIQLLNVLLFSIVKFFIASRAIENK